MCVYGREETAIWGLTETTIFHPPLLHLLLCLLFVATPLCRFLHKLCFPLHLLISLSPIDLSSAFLSVESIPWHSKSMANPEDNGFHSSLHLHFYTVSIVASRFHLSCLCPLPASLAILLVSLRDLFHASLTPFVNPASSIQEVTAQWLLLLPTSWIKRNVPMTTVS